MIVKFLLFLVAVLGIGVILTLSLPEYKEGSGTIVESPYVVDADSIKTPQPLSAYLLPTPTPPDAQFSLRLGLYSQLSQATEFADSLELKDTSSVIVKATDPQRDWYLVLLGPYDSLAAAEQKREWLQSEQISATIMLWPATEESDE